MKNNSFLLTFLAALMCCMLLSAGIVYADTDGTELQVSQPMTLELQLGPQWAGVEFQLKTDAGLYPGTIIVGEDGVLRTELGGSSNYTLSCIDSSVVAPAPDGAQAPATPEPDDTLTEAPTEDTAAQEEAPSAEETPTGEQTPSKDEQTEESTVGGIPVKHLILFGGGLILAVGGLVAIRIVKKRRATSGGNRSDNYDEEDEDY